MKYKFVDIGTCFYATSIDDFGLHVDGILVEPIKKFLDTIPNSPTIKKECSAISDNNGLGLIYTYFSPEQLAQTKLEYFTEEQRRQMIKDKTFASFLADMLPSAGISSLKTRDKWINPEFQINPPPCYEYPINYITLTSLIEKYNISEIEYLRIDCEGHEPKILKQVYEQLKSNNLAVREIQFERDKKDTFSINSDLNLITSDIISLGYSKSISKKDSDVILTMI